MTRNRDRKNAGIRPGVCAKNITSKRDPPVCAAAAAAATAADLWLLLRCNTHPRTQQQQAGFRGARASFKVLFVSIN